jgi:hypothetical protein
MKKKILPIMAIISILFGSSLFAQTTIKGTITDKSSGKPIPKTNVFLKQDSIIFSSTTSDAVGMYSFTGVPAGVYDVQVVDSVEKNQNYLGGVSHIIICEVVEKIVNMRVTGNRVVIMENSIRTIDKDTVR